MVKFKNYRFNSFDHLAGIVPIGGLPLDFNMPWHDSMIPVGQNYLAVERAVLECAMAGCETIWIVGHKGTTPIIRKRLADFIRDPVSLQVYGNERRTREIPIFYVPIRPRDYDRRDCLGWSVLYGADCAFRVSCFISRWVAPKLFYCSFPYGVTSENFISDQRKRMRITEKTTIFSYEGKTVKDGLHIPFTFNFEDYKKCRDIVKKKNLEDWHERKQKSARLFTLQEVFEPLDTVNNNVIELPWFYDISSWKKYCDYAGTDHAKNLSRNDNVFTKQKRRIFPKDRVVEELYKYDELEKLYEQENGEILQQSTEQDQTKNESS